MSAWIVSKAHIDTLVQSLAAEGLIDFRQAHEVGHSVMRNEDTPRVWVGCLACYSTGRLVGDWFDASEAGDITIDQVHDLYAKAGSLRLIDVAEHEELWVFDHENFHGLLMGECSPAFAQHLAERIETVTELGYPVAAYAAHEDYTGSSSVVEFEDAYNGKHDSEEDFARGLADELGLIPENYQWPVSCIDWEQATRELFMGDYWSSPAPDGGVYVFRSC
ncbi:MAG TPA: antirestriction protein ArdA [Acidimicrobiia bacterium]|nr:antirestriction protein ArdA [Acidimicrobiia bacterium]